MSAITFLKHIKQRKILQWALAYLAGAWLIMQLMDVLGGRWGFTDAMGRTFDLAVVVGIFVVLVVAWYHGEKGPQRVSGSELLLIAGILGIGGVAFSFVDLSDPADSETNRFTPIVIDDNRPSVAVLPFTNRSTSGGEDAAIFAVGIHEDILTKISQIDAIKVISRTSVMGFEDRAHNVREVAKALGVRTVLEGGVQVAGGQVRINLQLIDATVDAQLWAESYQEALTTENIFTIQGKVARRVAAALEATLTAAEEQQIDKVGTDSLEAYQLYLKGREYWNRRTPTSIGKAIEYFQAAIEADGNYATAYAGLADVYHHLGLAIYSVAPPDEIIPKAKDALLRALELDNEIAEAYAGLGMIRSWYDRDWDGAEQAFTRAIEINPNYSPAYQWYAHYLMAQGDFDGAVTQIKKAQTLDPRSLITYMIASLIFDAAGHPDQAIAEAEAALEINPHFWSAHTMLAFAHGSQSRFDEAIAAAERAVSDSRRAVYAVATLGWAYARSGERERALEMLAELQERSETTFVSPFNLALIRMGLGDTEMALQELERAVPELFLLYMNSWHVYGPVRGELRFSEIVNEMKL